MTGDVTRAAVEWLVAAMAKGTDTEEVTRRVAPRLLTRGDLASVLSSAKRFEAFRTAEPLIERVESRGQWAARASVRTGEQEWEVDIAVEPEPPHLIRSFAPRPVDAGAVPWEQVSASLRTGDHTETSLPAPAAEEIHRLLLAEVEHRRLPSMAVAIAVGGEVVHREFLGVTSLETLEPVDSESAYRVGSVTKVVTALAVLRLVEQGRLDVDHPISEYLSAPRFAPAAPTVRQVLLHAGGVPPDLLTSLPALSAGVSLGEAIAEVPLAEAKPVYSNLGYGLLGALIEEVAGEPYAVFATREVLARFGMDTAVLGTPGNPTPATVTGYRLAADKLAAAPPYRTPLAASGGLACSVDDLTALAVALAEGTDPLMRLALTITGPSPLPDVRFAPGLALFDHDRPDGRRPLRGSTTALKEGAVDGFTAEISASVGRAESLAVAVMTSKSPPENFGDLAARLLEV
jgi:CubicO group peptidase (beta-lactamase class C family)